VPTTNTTPPGLSPGQLADDNVDRETRDRHDRIMLRRYAESRDPLVREALIERFMPLARSLAWRYAGTNEPVDDLMQVAAEGLVKAVDRYEPERATAFSSYATPVILGSLRHYFRDSTQRVHVPRSLQENMQKVSSELERIEGDLGHSAGLKDIVESTELEEAEVSEALEALATRRPASIDATVRATADADDGGSPLAETIGAEETGFDRVEASLAADTVDLDPQERAALRLRFEGELNQREIGERIGTSQMQVSRLLRRSLTRILDAVQGSGPAETTS
jgi:RNA polymerase sigma-B factor